MAVGYGSTIRNAAILHESMIRINVNDQFIVVSCIDIHFWLHQLSALLTASHFYFLGPALFYGHVFGGEFHSFFVILGKL